MIGTRQVESEDRMRLPFTDAVIHEIQRFASIGPISLPRKTCQDVTFQGHFIKKVGLNTANNIHLKMKRCTSQMEAKDHSGFCVVSRGPRCILT